MKIMIIGLPNHIDDQAISKALVEFSKALNTSVYNVKVINTDEFLPPHPDETLVKLQNALDDIIGVCTAQGKSFINLSANYWRLVQDGKITKEILELIFANEELSKKYLHEHACLNLFTLMKISYASAKMNL